MLTADHTEKWQLPERDSLNDIQLNEWMVEVQKRNAVCNIDHLHIIGNHK